MVKRAALRGAIELSLQNPYLLPFVAPMPVAESNAAVIGRRAFCRGRPLQFT
jgi:hypothetical protein